MTRQYLVQVLTCCLFVIAVSACTAVPPPRTPTPTPTLSSASWAPDMTPSISADSLRNAARQEIVKALFEQYLHHYQNSGADTSYRLDAFEIQSIDVSTKWQEYARDDNEFAAAVRFSVKPSVFEYSHWNAGSGETGDNGWIRNSFLLVRVLAQDGVYQLQLLGGG